MKMKYIMPPLPKELSEAQNLNELLKHASVPWCATQSEAVVASLGHRNDSPTRLQSLAKLTSPHTLLENFFLLIEQGVRNLATQNQLE